MVGLRVDRCCSSDFARVLSVACRANRLLRFVRSCSTGRDERSKPLRGKTHFVRNFNPKRRAGPLRRKNLLSFFPKSCMISASRLIDEGRCARSSRHARRGGDGREAAGSVLARGRTAGHADVKSQRPDTPTLVSSATRSCALSRHGGQKARRTRETAYKRENRRAGNAGCSAGPVVPAACIFCCRRAMGCGQRPAFPAPSRCFEGRVDRIPRASVAARP